MYLFVPVRLLHPLFRAFGVQNNNLPLDVIQKLYARGFLQLSGINVVCEGLENVNVESNTLALFSHASNLDPFIVAGCGPYAFKWIGKKELFKIPILGWVLYLLGHISIDRSDRTKAIASLNEAVVKIHKWHRSIAISPEGTRSKSGRITDFKKGPFHIIKQVGLPMTPIIIIGAFDLWPPGAIFTSSGTITLRYLPQIKIQESDDVTSLMSRARRTMLQGAALPLDKSAKPYCDNRIGLLFLLICYATLFLIFLILKYVVL